MTIIGTTRPVLLHDIAHAEYNFWEQEWQKIRDCIIGETEIKNKTTTYLRKMEGQSDPEYGAFLDRAVFYNMVERTVNGLTGTVFRQPPVLENWPVRLEDSLEIITHDGMELNLFSKVVTEEVLTTGRYGILVDMHPNGQSLPYFQPYIAENIIDWQTTEIEGRMRLTRVVLREVRSEKATPGTPTEFLATFRVLELIRDPNNDDRLTYVQTIFREEGRNADITSPPAAVFTPTKNGTPFDFIPFVFMGPHTLNPDVEKSPVLDIVHLNLSHYKSMAQLEHGRFYTGLPIYWVATTDTDKTEYTIGPNIVWGVLPGEKPGLLEFNGQGLKFLENAADQKEHQISSLGGRMLGVRTQAVAESDNTVALKEKNEQSLLLNVTTTVSQGITRCLKWYAFWMNQPFEDIKFILNQDFLDIKIGAREFRAFHSMYTDGIIPIDVFFNILDRVDLIPDGMTMDEFKVALSDPEQFPNQLDVLAKIDGFPDAETKFVAENPPEEPEEPELNNTP